jgi:hypothetical protein
MSEVDPQPVAYKPSTPLVEAIQLDDEKESVRWVEELLNAGEDPNVFDHVAQMFPLDAAWSEAVWKEQKTDRSLRLLLESGADVRTMADKSPYLSTLIVNGPVEITHHMFEHGLGWSCLYSTTQIGERICGFDNPLTELIEAGDYEKLKKLEPLGILDFIHVFDELGDAPLGYFAREGNRIAADWLLKHGADINLHSESRIGDTALDRAVHEHDLRMIEFLLNRGANPNIPTWMWITATDRVSEYESPKSKGRHDASKDSDLIEIKRMVLDASKKFPPPTYPDGSKPKVWPPEPTSK